MAHKSVFFKGSKQTSAFIPSLLSFSRFLQTQTQSSRPTTSFLQKTRRLKERELVKAPWTNEEFVVIQDSVGNESDLNWSFAAHGVVPEHHSYRNLSLRRYVVHSETVVDRKTKAVLVDVKQTDVPRHTVGQGNFSAEHFSQLVADVKKHLEDAKELFMQDGTVGAHSSVEVRVRVFTNSGATALTAKHLLSPARLVAKSARLFQADVKVWFVPSFSAQNPGKYGVQGSSFVAVNPSSFEIVIAGTPSSQAFVDALGELAALKAVHLVKPAVSFDRTTTIKEAFDKLIPYKLEMKTHFAPAYPNSNLIKSPLANSEIGVLDNNKLIGRVVLSDVVAMYVENGEKRSRDAYIARNVYPQVHDTAFIDSVMTDPRPAVVPLTGDAILHSDNKSTTLVLSQNSLFLKSNLSSKLYGAHNVFWTSNGLVRAWQGVSRPSDASKLTFGEVVEKASNGTKGIVSLKTPNVLSHPTNIVFLVSDSKGALPTLGKLNSAQAAQFLAAGYNGNGFTPFYNSLLSSLPNAAELSSSFKSHVEAGKVNVYVVNSQSRKKELSTQELEKVFNVIVGGSAAKASGKDGKLFSAVTSVPGLSNLENGNAASLEQEFNTFLQTKFPNVTF